MAFYVQQFATGDPEARGRKRSYYTIAINSAVALLAAALWRYTFRKYVQVDGNFTHFGAAYTLWIIELVHIPLLFLGAWLALNDYIAPLDCGKEMWNV